MELHPLLFVIMTYGITAIIALCVAFIIKIIALIVRRKGSSTAAAIDQKES